MVVFGIGMLTGMCMIAVAPLSYITEVRARMMIDVSAGRVIGVATDIGVDIFATVDANICVATVTTLESIPILVSSENISLFGWKTCSC